MFQKIAKHRANDASNDVHRPPLAPREQNACDPSARCSGQTSFHSQAPGRGMLSLSDGQS